MTSGSSVGTTLTGRATRIHSASNTACCCAPVGRLNRTNGLNRCNVIHGRSCRMAVRGVGNFNAPICSPGGRVSPVVPDSRGACLTTDVGILS